MNQRFSGLLQNSAGCVSDLIGQITHICRAMGKRAPGSEGERAAAEYMADVLERECGCAEARIESFAERPGAFYGYFRFSMAFDVLCALSFFAHPLLSVLFGACALALFVFQFVMYRQVIDPLFPSKRGTNVTAVRPCGGAVERRIFLSGHIDAAWEFPLNYRFGGVVFELPGLMAFAGVLYYIAVSVCVLCGAGAWTRAAGRVGLLFVPFFILVAFTCDPRRVVDGANDNLTGCWIGITLLREMERQGITLEHTEVGVILTGSEEAGLRGAKAWCAAHGTEYRDVPTCILCFDTIHDPRFLMVNERDLNGTVASDRTICDVFLRAAEEAGVPCRRGMVPLFGGATDSAAFTQGGFRSAAVTGLNHRLEDYYHTRRDTCDHLDAEGIENCYRAAVMFLCAADEGALDP